MATAHSNGSHSLERGLPYFKGINVRHVLRDAQIELVRDEERKITPLSSASFISANSRCCLMTIKNTRAGDCHAFFSQTGICRCPGGLGERSFQGERARLGK